MEIISVKFISCTSACTNIGRPMLTGRLDRNNIGPKFVTNIERKAIGFVQSGRFAVIQKA